jgi:Flp pilus assembly protein TadD
MAAAVERRRRQAADPLYRARVDGLALLEQGRLAQAQDKLQMALDAAPRDVELVGAMGLLRMRQGRHGEALALFRRALALEPRNTQWTSLARTSQYWSFVQEAKQAREAGNAGLEEERLLQAHALDPREPESALELASFYAAHGRGAEAQRLYREVLGIVPNEPRALEGLIGLALKEGHENDATALIEALTPAQRTAFADTLGRMRAERLRGEAARLQSQGR